MNQRHELPTFLGKTGLVELVATLDDVSVNGSSVLLRCSTKRYDLERHDYYGTVCETVFREPTDAGPATVRLDFCTDQIVRLRYAPGPEVPDIQTPMVVGTFDGVEPQVGQDDRQVTLATGALRVVVRREPWQLTVYDRDGGTVFRTRPLDLDSLRRIRDPWNTTEQRWLFYHRYAYPLGVARAGGSEQVFASFDLRHDEHVYGFGEGFGRLDKRGTMQHLWLREAFGNASPGAYKQAPFYLSTRGYGLFVNTSNAVRFNVGDLEHTALSVTVDDASWLDYYLLYGPSLKEILPRYTAITGTPAVPPKWSFGLWMSRISYRSQEEVETVARELRERRIPCDVIHIDTEWFERDWECDLEFSASRFPDPAAMTAKLRAAGFRICLWQWPNLLIGTRLFEEGREAGYLARRPNGQPYLFSGFLADAGVIDYSNPDAAAWIREKLRALFELGVAAIKTDFGEGAPPDASYHAVAGSSMHNLYPLLYNRAVFEATEQAFGEGQAMVWSRSAWAGSQRYPVHWSGDGIARYEDLACVLRAALSFGLSGFPFYSHDIGGFSGVPDPELYVRWAQLGLFSSHARCHGNPPREPWAYGEAAEAIFRRYDELRYRLLPYIYSEAVEAARASLPMVRAMVLEYQDDPTTHAIDDQYLFGRDLLVAPVLDERPVRLVYLPRGRWVDYWTKATLEGGRWVEVATPLEVLPLFVRAGAILPHGPLQQHVDEQPGRPLRVEVYAPPDDSSHTYVVHDDGRPDATVAYRRTGDRLDVRVAGTAADVDLALYGPAVTGAWRSGYPLEIRAGEDAGSVLDLGGPGLREVAVVLSEGRAAGLGSDHLQTDENGH